MADEKKTDKDLEGMSNADLIELIKNRREENKLLKEKLTIKKDYSKMSKEELADTIRIKETNADGLAVMMKMASSMGDISGALKYRKQLQSELNELNKIEEQSLATKNDAAQKRAILEEEIKNQVGEATDKQQEMLDSYTEIIEQEQDLIKQNKQKLIILQQQVDALGDQYEKYLDLSDAAQEVHKESKAMFESFGQAAFGLVNVGDTGIGKFAKMAGLAAGARDGTSGMMLAFKEVFNLANLAATMFAKVFESTILMIKKLDEAATSFAKATGAGNRYRAQLEDIVRGGLSVGVYHEEAGKAFVDLRSGLSAFTKESVASQNALITQAAQFERLGVAGSDTADLMNTFSRTMNLSSQQAMDLTKNIGLMGTELGISADKMIKDFQESQKTLAVYGKSGVKAFTNLAAAAKAAGVEMNSLLGIAGKFDTFEDAADSVGQLNAILGANLSATEMLMMTEDQRVESVIQQIQISGESFAQMDRFKQKAVANAVGITDMAEANKVFGMSMSQYRDYSSQMSNSETTQDKWNETINATITLQEKMMAIVMKMAPKVEGMLDKIHSSLDTIMMGMDALTSAFANWPYIVAGFGALALALKSIKIYRWAKGLKGGTDLLKKGVDGVQDSMEKIVDKGKGAGGTINDLGDKMEKGGNKMQKGGAGFASSAKSIAAIGVAALGIGAGIWLAATGTAKLALAFKDLGDNAGWAALGIALLMVPFVVFMLVLAKLVATGVLPAAAAGLWAVGGAMALMGLGIAVAALGMAQFVKAFASLTGEQLNAAVLGIVALVAGFLGFAAALYFLVPAMIGAIPAGVGLAATLTALAVPVVAIGQALAFAGLGMMLASAGLALVVASFALVDVEKIHAMGGAFLGLAKGLLVFAAAVGVFAGMAAFWKVALIGIGLMAAALLTVGSLIGDLAAISGWEGTFTIVGVMAGEIDELNDAITENVQSTLDSLVALSTNQSVENINTNVATTRHEQMITITQTLHNELDIDVKIGDTSFAKAVKKVVKEIDWNGAEMERVASRIVVAGD